MNMFSYIYNENIWSKILMFDLKRAKQAPYYGMEGVVPNHQKPLQY